MWKCQKKILIRILKLYILTGALQIWGAFLWYMATVILNFTTLKADYHENKICDYNYSDSGIYSFL